MAFFEDFGDVALWEVVRIGSWRTLAAGSVIIREGEQGDGFFLLVEGEVEVTLEAKELAKIQPGGCFGEIAVLRRRARPRVPPPSPRAPR